MRNAAEPTRFYEDAYDRPPQEAQLYSRWRALGAVGKAEHVIALCALAGLDPRRVVDVGCGDGALLSELHRRAFGDHLNGFEISEAAAALARERPEIAAVGVFDGHSLPVTDGAYDLGIVSHVLEHVRDPATLLAEVARACGAVVLEVPLEANLAAGRASKRAGAAEVGHLQRFSRAAVADIVTGAGLRIAARLDDPLPLEVHRFFAATRPARWRATIRWAVRRAVWRASPALARRSFTVHHACLCLPAGRD